MSVCLQTGIEMVCVNGPYWVRMGWYFMKWSVYLFADGDRDSMCKRTLMGTDGLVRHEVEFLFVEFKAWNVLRKEETTSLELAFYSDHLLHMFYIMRFLYVLTQTRINHLK